MLFFSVIWIGICWSSWPRSGVILQVIEGAERSGPFFFFGMCCHRYFSVSLSLGYSVVWLSAWITNIWLSGTPDTIGSIPKKEMLMSSQLPVLHLSGSDSSCGDPLPRHCLRVFHLKELSVSMHLTFPTCLEYFVEDEKSNLINSFWLHWRFLTLSLFSCFDSFILPTSLQKKSV